MPNQSYANGSSGGTKRPASPLERGSSSSSIHSSGISSGSITPSSSGPSTPKQSRSQINLANLQRRVLAKRAKTLPYELTESSIVLYRPEDEDLFHITNNPNGIVPVIVNPHFSMLRQEQKDGLLFLWSSIVDSKNGCILGHGMGLGKTLTAISLLFTLFEQKKGSRGQMIQTIKKAVIITPKSILPVWEKQIAEWSPENRKLDYVTIISGMKTTIAEETIRNFERNDKRVILMSYDNFKKYYNLFRDYDEPLDLAILDEAHYVKNAKARRTEVFGPYLLDNGSGNRATVKTMVGLTGTPYQNNDEELCNLVNFFRPNYLPPSINDDLKKLRNLLNTARNPKTRPVAIQKAKKDAQLIRRTLYGYFKPVIHYRSGRVQGVDKHEIVLCVKLCEGTQHKMYEELTRMEQFQKLDSFSKIHILRKLCWHPEYAYKQISEIAVEGRLQIAATAPFQAYVDELLSWNANGLPNYAESGKLNLVMEILAHIFVEREESNDKVIIVSYSNDQLQRVRQICDTLGFKYLTYPGEATTESQRDKIIDKFGSNGEQVQILFLSAEAGGQGLNLVMANHLILMDPGWTPAMDNQIVARIYRTGQKKNCFVYRILSTNTIEEVMFLNQLSKNEVDLYYRGENQELELQSGYDPKDLLSYHNSRNGSVIKDTIDSINNSNGEAQDSQEFQMEEDSIERGYFANELRESKQYSNVDQVPDVLDTLKAVWHHGVTFVFHKFLGDDGSNVYQTIEEILEVSDTETEDSQSQ